VATRWKLQPKAPWRAIVREFGIDEAVAQDAHRTHKLPPGITGDAVTRFLELPAGRRNALMHGIQQSIGAAVAGILHEFGDPSVVVGPTLGGAAGRFGFLGVTIERGWVAVIGDEPSNTNNDRNRPRLLYLG
jgi:hypothetical protein